MNCQSIQDQSMNLFLNYLPVPFPSMSLMFKSPVCPDPTDNSDVLSACPVSVHELFVSSVLVNALGFEQCVHHISANTSCFELSANPVEPSVCPMSSNMFEHSVCPVLIKKYDVESFVCPVPINGLDFDLVVHFQVMCLKFLSFQFQSMNLLSAPSVQS